MTFLAIAVCSWAQTDRGSIRGTIVDQTGAVVPGAAITVSNSANGISNSVRSNDSGVYGIAALPAGSYRVEVAQAGFKTLVRNNVVVDVGNVTGLDLTLEVGNSTQTVDVNAAAPILKTEQSSTSAEVAVDAYADLPLSAGGRPQPAKFQISYARRPVEQQHQRRPSALRTGLDGRSHRSERRGFRGR